MKFTPLKHHRRANLCSGCGHKMRSHRYAVDYTVYGCSKCNKTYYWDSRNRKHIELAFSYEDFFEDISDSRIKELGVRYVKRLREKRKAA